MGFEFNVNRPLGPSPIGGDFLLFSTAAFLAGFARAPNLGANRAYAHFHHLRAALVANFAAFLTAFRRRPRPGGLALATPGIDQNRGFGAEETAGTDVDFQLGLTVPSSEGLNQADSGFGHFVTTNATGTHE